MLLVVFVDPLRFHELLNEILRLPRVIRFGRMVCAVIGSRRGGVCVSVARRGGGRGRGRGPRAAGRGLASRGTARRSRARRPCGSWPWRRRRRSRPRALRATCEAWW